MPEIPLFLEASTTKPAAESWKCCIKVWGVSRLHLQKRSDPGTFCFILRDAPQTGKPRGSWDHGGCGITLGFALEEDVGASPVQSTPQLSPAKRGRSKGRADINYSALGLFILQLPRDLRTQRPGASFGENSIKAQGNQL